MIEWAFICPCCGQETTAYLSPDLSEDQSLRALDLIFGTPPVCSCCRVGAMN